MRRQKREPKPIRRRRFYMEKGASRMKRTEKGKHLNNRNIRKRKRRMARKPMYQRIPENMEIQRRYGMDLMKGKY